MKITIAALIGIALLAITPAFAQEPEHHYHHHPGAVAPAVVDSARKIVGPYYDDVADYVLLQTNDAEDTIVQMYITPDLGLVEYPTQLYYTDADCSGTPYMMIPKSTVSPPSNPGYFLVPFGFYAFVGNVLYYPATGAKPQLFASVFGRAPGSAACWPTGTPYTLFAPATSIDLSTLGFTPPFRVLFK